MAIMIGSLDQGNPLHLHANNSNCASIVSVKLTSVENYRIWASAMKLALQIKYKMGFVNGTCTRATYLASAPLLEQWDKCNAVVLNWILSSLSQDVYLGYVFSDNAKIVWRELQEIYNRIYGSIVFNLLQKINTFKQGGLPVFEYYHKLNSLWRESDILTKLPNCTCVSRTELIDHGKLLKLMQFLMGLDDIYQPIRSILLTRIILPEVTDAFVIISREESHKGIPPSCVKTNKPQVYAFMSRQSDNNRNRNNNWSNNGNNVNRANMAGANQHMTNSTKDMIDVVDVSDLKLTVGHPNGTLAKITHAGNLKLNNDVILFNVLVVPEYTVSLLYVHKLIKDSKLSVGFDETKCYIQDLRNERVLGTGSENGGLYLFYKKYNMSAVSNNRSVTVFTVRNK
ncbi:ribonuclease H-like domain-containing protein [Tanacetum coccineum]